MCGEVQLSFYTFTGAEEHLKSQVFTMTIHLPLFWVSSMFADHLLLPLAATCMIWAKFKETHRMPSTTKIEPDNVRV